MGPTDFETLFEIEKAWAESPFAKKDGPIEEELPKEQEYPRTRGIFGDDTLVHVPREFFQANKRPDYALRSIENLDWFLNFEKQFNPDLDPYHYQDLRRAKYLKRIINKRFEGKGLMG